ERVNASFEVAQATYQSLMDNMGFEAKLDNTRAQQAMKQAETALRAARERLRILGVNPDGTEPQIEGGKVVGVEPDGTLVTPLGKVTPKVASPEAITLDRPDSDKVAAKPKGQLSNPASSARDAPVSTYSIWAPFHGTILDREMIVPGVAVDTTHRIFTMANLSTVWVEANVHENNFNMLARSRNGKVRFRSPAYPGRTFDGEVIYTGDLVEDQSLTVKLLARAQNPERLLKPGMFIEVEVFSPGSERVAQIPASALLMQGDRAFVYVRTGPEQFERRDVVAGAD